MATGNVWLKRALPISLFLVLICLGIRECSNRQSAKPAMADTATALPVPKDDHTLSNADSIRFKHLDISIKVDFDKKQLSGTAIWQIENYHHLHDLKLDTYDLSIDSVSVNGHRVQHSVDSAMPNLGAALHVPVTDSATTVAIYYKTGAKATALQWLQPAQTSGKKHPFLYTQSESIYARSWIPCPDGPGIRFTYTAHVSVPPPLMALMSAHNPQQPDATGTYHFNMEIPVPAYLMALAVGDIRFKSIEDRTGVYAEPDMLDKAAYELADMGKMVHTAESLYGAYRWGRYDVIILPPGFPIGGMENPRLTFCTPTIIAGDRSLVSLIAHELAHSWSGNLVTNATWNDFWMNEGFTTYFERRIVEAMTDKSYADMQWELGYQDLQAAIEELGKDNKDTWLKLDLKGRHPEEGLTDIAYEKGCHFLRLLENTCGRSRFDSFLKKYFNEHAFSTITTEQFLQYLDKNLLKGDSALYHKINVHAWVYGPGIPANCPRAGQERFEKVDAQRALFLKGAAPQSLSTTGWSTHEWLQFLRKMPKPLTLAQMSQLDEAFHFTRTGNSEIADVWFLLSISSGYTPAYPAMDAFLSRVGRRKFIMPLYTEMLKTPACKQMAIDIYHKYRANYHPLAQASLDKIVLGGK